MDIIINQQGVKRRIVGPFEICLTEADLYALHKRLAEAVEKRWSYGWLKIYDEPQIEVTPNTEPLPWK